MSSVDICFYDNMGLEITLAVSVAAAPNDSVKLYTMTLNNQIYLLIGDLMDEESVLDFLTSLEAMDLPDRIEEVNQKILGKIIEDTEYVAVLFCEYQACLAIDASSSST